MYHGGRFIAQRRDANEGDIEELLHAHGFQTLRVDGAPFDLVVWCLPGRGFLLIDSKTEFGSMTKRGKKFFLASEGLPRLIARTPEAALAAAQEHCRLYGKGGLAHGARSRSDRSGV